MRFWSLFLFATAVVLTSAADYENLWLGADSTLLPAGNRAQAEPHITRNPADPAHLVAVFQEGRQAVGGGALACGCAVSTNAGRNWTRVMIPRLASLTGGIHDRVTDPVAAIDADGTVFVNTLAFNNSSQRPDRDVMLSVSTNGGLSFPAPILVHAGDADRNDQPDKNWITINTFPGTPSYRRVVVTWTRFSKGDLPPHPIVSSFSDDRGATWTEPVVISPSECQGSFPAFLPNGTLVVLYYHFGGAALELARSPDGGSTFETPRLIAEHRAYKDPVARDGTFVPSLATDRINGILYVAVQGLAPGTMRPSILFYQSTDHGVTWTSPRAINDTPDNASVFTPTIAASADGQHVTVAFYDKRHDTGQGYLTDLFLAESFDGGLSWQPNRRLTSTSTDLRNAPQTPSGYMLGDYSGLVAGTDVDHPAVACWIDGRNGAADPYVASIPRDRGATFGTWQRLLFGSPANPHEGILPDTASAGADPDADGLSNATEYALGTLPLTANREAVLTVRRSSRGASVLAEVLLLKSLADIQHQWQNSETLRNWEPLADTVTLVLEGTQPYFERLQLPLATDKSTMDFLRFTVSLTE